MSEVPPDDARRAEHPRARVATGAAARLEILKNGEVVASGDAVAMYEDLIVGTTLSLGHAATDALARGQSYSTTFKGCTARLAGVDLGAFKVIHGGFMLFKTGEHTIADFGLCLGPVHIEYISESARYLRELRARRSP